MADLTECSICMETLKTPKGLPCIHTFCLACLQQYGKDKQPGKEMACPLCRKLFTIPPGGFVDLPGNFFIQDMLESKDMLKRIGDVGPQSILPTKCEACSGTASGYCVECDQSLCKACTKSHRKLRITASHKVVSLEEKDSSAILTRARPRFCSSHSDKPLELFCYDCKHAICLMCSVLTHKIHHCELFDEYSKKFKEEVNKGYPALRSCIEDNEKELEQLQSYKSAFLEQISAKEHQIEERCTELKRLVDKERSQLLKQLEEVKEKRLKKLRTRQDDVERQLMVLTNFKNYLEELSEKGSACDIAVGASELIARSEELLKSQDKMNKNKVISLEVFFTVSEMPGAMDEGTGLIGQLYLQVEETITQPAVGMSGWEDDDHEINRQICHVGLDHSDSMNATDSTPTTLTHGLRPVP